jgi:hypothetical protein
VTGCLRRSNQEASTVAEAPVTNFFCRLRVPQGLHSCQGCNFESCLTQEVLERLGMSKTHITPLHPQSLHRTRGIGTQDYPSSSSLTGHLAATLRT